jgi:hypothetical protein
MKLSRLRLGVLLVDVFCGRVGQGETVYWVKAGSVCCGEVWCCMELWFLVW